MGFISEFSVFRALKARDKTLVSKLEVWRGIKGATTVGTESIAWTKVFEVNGRLRRPGKLDFFRWAGAQQQPVARWEVSAPVEAEIRVRDRLYCGDLKFSVVGTDRGRTEALIQVLQCELI